MRRCHNLYRILNAYYMILRYSQFQVPRSPYSCQSEYLKERIFPRLAITVKATLLSMCNEPETLYSLLSLQDETKCKRCGHHVDFL